MNWRDFFVTNRWQKLFSLALATLIWLTVRSGIELAPMIEELGRDARQFERLPITVLTSAADLGHYSVQPERVTVVLRGDRLQLEQVLPAQLEVYVNLVESTGKLGTRPVHVYAPSGTEVVSVQPREVLVERLTDSKVGSEQR